MKEIQLTKGNVAIVDDDDYEELNKHKWFCDNGYAVRNLRIGIGKRTKIFMHGIIMNTPKGLEVDHIDGNSFNNQKANLRVCTHQQNCFNRKSHKRITSSIYKGVCYYKRNHMWLATVKFCGKQIHLGYFKSEEEAAKAYNSFVIIHYGEYACLNQI